MLKNRPVRLGGHVLAAVAAASLTFAASAQAQPGHPAIPLNNGQESPDPVMDGAHGFFTYEISGSQFCYTLTVKGLSAPATAAHVHLAPRNTPGPVVIPLVVPAAPSFQSSGCTSASAALLAAIAANPGAYYVNVHNANNPPGEIRGQLK